MKFGFVTCVQLGLSCMEAIYAAGGRLDLAITLPDQKARTKSGRIYLDEFCAQNGVPLFKAGHINEIATAEEIQARGIDWLFIIGWSQIAGPAVLAAPSLGTLGIHPTLLPQGRGRAAIPWAILKRLPKTGVTLFQLAEGVDTGPIVAQKEIPLSSDADASWLYDQVNQSHVALIKEVLPRLITGALIPIPQDDSRATLWAGRKPEDGRIDLGGSVRDAECLVRAVTRPYPGAFLDQNGRRTTIWKSRIVPVPTGDCCLSFPDGFLECVDYDVLA
ncbi:MAG: formyltransferase family protein [Lacunisphaera sp.]